MKTIARFIQKILSTIVILLILGTIGIFVYPNIADKTDADDKAVAFLAQQADKLAPETTEEAAWGEEVGTDGGDVTVAEQEDILGGGMNVSGSQSSSQPVTEEDIDEAIRDDSRTQTWNAEDKDALKKVYGTILNWMGLGTHNLLFYEMKDIGGTEYYTFQVVDDFGDAYERLMYFDDASDGMYWHDANGNLSAANSNDCIFSGRVQGQENVEYEDTDWKSVMDQYLKVMFDEQNREKADTYIDNSCYYMAALSENNRKRFIEATEELQEEIITLSESYEDKKKNKVIDDYSWSYEILDTEEYIDEFEMDWVDVYIAFNLDIKQHGQMDLMGEYYCIRLRDYPYGWRVASFSEDY